MSVRASALSLLPSSVPFSAGRFPRRHRIPALPWRAGEGNMPIAWPASSAGGRGGGLGGGVPGGKCTRPAHDYVDLFCVHSYSQTGGCKVNHLGGAGEGASAPVPYRSAARGIYPRARPDMYVH